MVISWTGIEIGRWIGRHFQNGVVIIVRSGFVIVVGAASVAMVFDHYTFFAVLFNTNGNQQPPERISTIAGIDIHMQVVKAMRAMVARR